VRTWRCAQRHVRTVEEEIVPAFYSSQKRALTEFAVA
jgi:hypothetical protein